MDCTEIKASNVSHFPHGEQEKKELEIGTLTNLNILSISNKPKDKHAHLSVLLRV